MTQFAIILPTLNEGPMLAMTVDSIIKNSGENYFQIIVVDDGCTDGCIEPVANYDDDRIHIVRGGGLGVALARNRGAAEADANILTFMDAHCQVSEGWLDELYSVIIHPEVGMVGPSFTRLDSDHPRCSGMYWVGYELDPCWIMPPGNNSPFETPLTTGACQVMRRDTFVRLGGYDPKFTKWGYEDVEMCIRIWCMGWSVVAQPRVIVAHDFKESRDNYDVPEEGVLHNFLRLAYLHFSPTRLYRLMGHFSSHQAIQKAQHNLFKTSIFKDREILMKQRIRDDDWFFSSINGELV